MIILSTKTKGPFSQKDLERFFTIAGTYEKKIAGDLSVTFLGEKAIQKINREQRGKDKPTDVISFGYSETPWKGEGGLIGEIYLCYSYIRKQAKRFETTPKEEFVRMFVHGLLHVVGYDHVTEREAKKMFPLQEKIVKKCLL